MEAKWNIKGVIFDLDGVLVSTDQLHYQAWKRIADENGIYFDEEINQRLRGVSRMESLEIILERYEGPAFQEHKKVELAQEKNRVYRELLNTMTPHDVTPEVRYTLRELRNRGYRIGLGSSSKNAKLILKQTNLEGAFDCISDGTNITKSKPDPEVFLKAAFYLGLNPWDCVVVEDAQAGIQAGISGQMKTVSFGEKYEGTMADCHVNDINQLLNLLT